MTDLDRIIKVIEWLIFDNIVKNRRDLAEKMGYTESSLSQIINNKVALSGKFIKKLSDIDKRININWLLTGEGPMLKTMVERKLLEQILPDEILTQKNNQPKMEAQEVLIEQMRSEIEHLRNELLSWKDECQKKNETINNLLSMVTGNQVTKKKEAS